MAEKDILVGVSSFVGGIKHHPLLYKRDYSFNKVRDLKRVEPASIMLLSEILASGVVPPDVENMDFNDIDDPNNIAGRVQNVFDAIDIGKDIARSASKPGSNSPTVSPEGGSE